MLPGDTVTLGGEIEKLKSFEVVATDKVKPADVLVKSLLSPPYVAVSVRDPVVEKIKLQLPVPPERGRTAAFPRAATYHDTLGWFAVCSCYAEVHLNRLPHGRRARRCARDLSSRADLIH